MLPIEFINESNKTETCHVGKTCVTCCKEDVCKHKEEFNSSIDEVSLVVENCSLIDINIACNRWAAQTTGGLRR